MPGVAEDAAIGKEKVKLAVTQLLQKLIQGELLRLEEDAWKKAPQGQHRRSKGVRVEGGAKGILDADADGGGLGSKRRTGNNKA